MIDPLAASVDAIVHDDATRLPLVALAGAMTSLGPCVAPRYVALAALLGERRRALVVAAFVAGMLSAYVALGFGAGVLASVTLHASAFYLALAAALSVSGAVTLLRTSRHAPDGRHHCGGASPHSRRLGAVFCMGAGSAFVVSPCCTPVVAAIAATAAFDANPFARAALLGAFALGHALPLFAVGAFGRLFAGPLQRWNAGPAPAVVSGSLLLALGGYYGLLV